MGILSRERTAQVDLGHGAEPRAEGEALQRNPGKDAERVPSPFVAEIDSRPGAGASIALPQRNGAKKRHSYTRGEGYRRFEPGADGELGAVHGVDEGGRVPVSRGMRRGSVGAGRECGNSSQPLATNHVYVDSPGASVESRKKSRAVRTKSGVASR